MTRRSRFISLGLLLFMIVSTSRSLQAGEIMLYEFGTPGVGLAAAGCAARAQDASTLFKNPAGMSELDQSQLQTGLQLIYGDYGFEPDGQTTTSGSDGGNPIGALPGGGLFYVHSFGPDFRAGVGTFSYFGLGAKFDDDWVGR
jgi:long-chain fatty acid transport protein